MITDGIINLFVCLQSQKLHLMRPGQHEFYLFDSIFYSLLSGRIPRIRKNEFQVSSAERHFQNVADMTIGVNIFE